MNELQVTWFLFGTFLFGISAVADMLVWWAATNKNPKDRYAIVEEISFVYFIIFTIFAIFFIK